MTIALIVTVFVTISAGNWQTRRAADKIERQQLLDERARLPALELRSDAVSITDVEWRSIAVTGRPLTALTILIDNRVHNTRAGYHVLTPIEPIDGGPAIVVNRGWLAAGDDRSVAPTVPSLPSPTTVSGVAIAWPSRTFELKDVPVEAPAGQAPVWQGVTLERYRDSTRLGVQPVIMQQASASDDGLVRQWPAPALGVEKHRMYSLQWYSFAALAVVLYLMLNLKRV